jgi:sugar-phosphatase
MVFACSGVLLDMDGVLVDSTPAVARVWRKWAEERGLDPQKVIDTAHGRRSIETIRIFAPEIDTARENIRVEQMEIDDKEGVTALPGAADFLRSLPEDSYAIVTSATRALAEARLEYAGLPAPRYMVSADDVREGKPSPEPFLKGASLLAVAPENCIVFEDAPSGLQAAHAAGMKVVALSTTYPLTELGSADAVVDSLAQTRACLQDSALHIYLGRGRALG